MQWLIFGATGYTGSALLAECIALGHSVWAHVRPNSSRRAVIEQECHNGLNANAAILDFTVGAIEDLIQRVQPSHIALCLGTTKAKAKLDRQRGEPNGYAQIDRDLSVMVIEAAQRLEIDTCICYVSSMGADKPRGNAYLQARHDVEQLLMGSGLRYIIVRPAFISGSDRSEFRLGERVGSVIGDALLQGVGLLGFKNAQAAYGSLSAQDLAKGLMAAAESEEVAQLLYPQHLRYHLQIR